MKSAPDRCVISLRTEEYRAIIDALVAQENPDDQLIYKLTRAEGAAKARGDAAKTEADLRG